MSIDRNAIQPNALQAQLSSFGTVERRVQDLESERDQCFRNVTVLKTKFENGRWYVKMADDVTVQNGEGQLTTQGHDATDVNSNPNFQSDWLPWQTVSNDAVSFSIPPRDGQRATLSAPYGRPEMGHVAPYHTGPSNPLPSGVPDEVRMQIKAFDQAPTTNNPKPPDGSAPNSTFDHIINKDGHTTQVSSTTKDGQSQGPYSKTTHTKTDKTLTTQKVTQKTEQSKIKEAAQDTISRGTGTSDPDQADQGDGGGSGNLPHELNRQLQGLRAEVTQHTHHISALHDVMSKLNTIALTKIPQLAMLQPFLMSKPENLQVAAQNVLGMLPQYVAFSMQQAVAKLTTSFMGAVQGQVMNNLSANMAGNLSQVAMLAATSDAASNSMLQFQAAQSAFANLSPPPAAASGSGGASAPAPTTDISSLVNALQPVNAAFQNTSSANDVSNAVSAITLLNPATAASFAQIAPLMNQLSTIYANNAGPGNIGTTIAPSMVQAMALTSQSGNIDTVALNTALNTINGGFTGAAQFGNIQGLLGQVTGVAGSASGLLSGLAGMLGSQENIVSGMTKSYRLGGY